MGFKLTTVRLVIGFDFDMYLRLYLFSPCYSSWTSPNSYSLDL